MDQPTRVKVAVLAAAIAVLLGAGIIGAATHDDESSVATSGTTTTSGASSTTVTEPPTTAPATTTPLTQPPATTAPGPTTTRAPAPAAAPTTTAAANCGTGQARAASQSTIAGQPDPNTYLLDVKVDIINDLTKAIVVDKLSVRLTYGDGTSELVDFPEAPGTQVQPKETKSLTVKKTTTKLPTSTTIDDLTFHILNQPNCGTHHLRG